MAPHWDSSNDYSYSDLVSFEDDNDAAAITDKITLYADGELVWGIEPDGTAPSDEPDPVNKTVYGDANCDGDVTVADATLIMQNLSNGDDHPISDDGKDNGDVNERGDGITAADALTIQKYLADLISDLPETA